MSTFCSIIRCNEENDTIVGTSTSCSASCGSGTKVRRGMTSRLILGHFDNQLWNLEITIQMTSGDEDVLFHVPDRSILIHQ